MSFPCEIPNKWNASRTVKNTSGNVTLIPKNSSYESV